MYIYIPIDPYVDKHKYNHILTLTWSTEHRHQKVMHLHVVFRVRKLPSLVETIIVMTIQIVAQDKANDFLTCRSLSFSLVFFSLFFGYGDILLLYSYVYKHGGYGLRASFFIPLPLLGYNCSRILCYYDSLLAPKYEGGDKHTKKKVTNILQ